MRVLVDECVDWRIIRDLHSHDARTVKQLGWEEVDDGSLLARAAEEFDVFLTVDTNCPTSRTSLRWTSLLSCYEAVRLASPICVNFSTVCEKS